MIECFWVPGKQMWLAIWPYMKNGILHDIAEYGNTKEEAENNVKTAYGTLHR